MEIYKEPYMFEVEATFTNGDFSFTPTNVLPSNILAKFEEGTPVFMKIAVSGLQGLSSFIVSLSEIRETYCIFYNSSLTVLLSAGAGISANVIYLMSDGSIQTTDPSGR